MSSCFHCIQDDSIGVIQKLTKLNLEYIRETEPEWEKDIEEEVKEECSKYGEVLHIEVDKGSKASGKKDMAAREGGNSRALLDGARTGIL